MLGPDLVREIERLVEERVEALLAERERRESGSPWLTIAEAADRLRVSERTVARRLSKGRVRSMHFGRRRLLHRDDCDALMQSGDERGKVRTNPARRRARIVDASGEKA